MRPRASRGTVTTSGSPPDPGLPDLFFEPRGQPMRTHDPDSKHRRDDSLVEHPVSATLAATAEGLAAAASAEQDVGEVFDTDDLARHRHRRTRRWYPVFKRRTQ